jgi:prepilin-type processing-associated H-X9-DG protein
LAHLLPYLEQNALYAEIPVTLFAGTDGAWWGGGWTAANNRVKTFECPGDDLTVTVADGVWAYLYMSGYGLDGGYFGGNYPSLGYTNYIGCAGALGDVSSTGDTFYGQWVGVYGSSNGIKITSITDGTSNTIGFGETLGGTDSGTRDFKMPWMAAGGQPTYWGLPEPTNWTTFGSKHTGVVNFAFCDGSVRSITKGVATDPGGADWYAFLYASGYQDGSVINWSLLGE